MNRRVDPALAASSYDPEYLISIILDIGEEMLISGAEVNRVEDTMLRICNAYGFEKINVFSITEFIFLSILSPDGKIVTQSRRVYSYSNNLERLEQLNGLSRYICSQKPDITALTAKMDSLKQEEFSYRPVICAVCYMIGCGGFAVFFGGTFRDVLVIAFIALGMYFMGKTSRVQFMNRIAYTVISCALAGTAAVLLTAIGIGQNLDMIMIGNIMLMIPGMALTNSIRDMLCGDIVAGLLRLIESLLVALAIAVGFSIPLLVLGGLL